jgi:hypothetical protein
MTTLQLLNENNAPIATISVDVITAEMVQGTILDHQFTPDMIRMFEAFQEMVEHQMFGYLDQFEQHLAALNLKVLIDDEPIPIEDLQVYDLSAVSFRLKTDAFDSSFD